MKMKLQNSIAAVFIFMAGTFVSFCSGSKIFTEIDFSFRNLEDIFPLAFMGHEVQLINKVPVFRKELECEDYRAGTYASVAAIEVCECTDSAVCQKNWKYLVEEKKLEPLDDYIDVEGKEKRFDYTEESGLSGLIWTNKSFLFQAEASTEKNLKSLLSGTEIAKLQ